jgi:hypothetical protein
LLEHTGNYLNGVPHLELQRVKMVRLIQKGYEAELIQGLLKKNEKKLAQSFQFTFRYIDDVL